MPDDRGGSDLLKEARDRFQESVDGTQDNRDAAEEDIKFGRDGDQWDETVKKLRKSEARPCLTINKLPSFVRQVVNDSRQNKPAISVKPVDNGADEDTAEVINGIVRSIERSSNSDIAYDTAIDHAVSGGFGFFRVETDYAHEDSFDMELRISRIPNPFQVHWDPSSSAFDASDWNYAFISDMYTKDEYNRKWPKANAISWEGETRDENSHWVTGDHVRVAEYFVKDERERKIVQLSDGRVFRLGDLPAMARGLLEDAGIDLGGQVKDDDLVIAMLRMLELEIVRERVAKYHEVCRYMINGVEELEEKEIWPGSMIPICPVWGEELYIGGQRKFRSMIRDARDPQAMFNFWRSASTELVALAPRAPWVGPKGFIPKGDEKKWAAANTRSFAYLEYDGQVAPSRQPFAGVPAGVLQEALNSSDDMKSIIGIYDAGLGARSNETSGKAILARQRESDVSNYHFIDNLSRAIAYCGRILVECIPHVYSARHTVRILGEDQKEKVVRLTQQGDGAASLRGDDGKMLYNLAVGKYDVTVDTGPSFSTQREETRETLIEIMRAVPGAGPYMGDILADHLDFQGADRLARRLKLLLPPEVQQAEADDDGADLPDEAKAIVAQASARVQQLEQQLQLGLEEMKKLQAKADDTGEKNAIEKQKAADAASAKAEEIKAKQAEIEIERERLALAREQLDLEKSREAHRQEMEVSRFNKEVDEAVHKDEGPAPAGADPVDRMRRRDSAPLAEALKTFAEALAGQNAQTQEMIAGVVKAMNAEKVIVHDERGRPVGVAPKASAE